MTRKRRQQSGTIDICEAPTRSGLSFMERRLTRMGVSYTVEKAAMITRTDSSEQYRVFVLRIDAEAYRRYFSIGSSD